VRPRDGAFLGTLLNSTRRSKRADRRGVEGARGASVRPVLGTKPGRFIRVAGGAATYEAWS